MKQLEVLLDKSTKAKKKIRLSVSHIVSIDETETTGVCEIFTSIGTKYMVAGELEDIYNSLITIKSGCLP